MASPYRIAIGVAIDPSQAKAGAAVARQEVGSIATAVKASTASLAENTQAVAANAAGVHQVFESNRRLQAANDPFAGYTRSAGLANHEVTQLSYQISDLIVQVGSGQSVLTAFLQQGPQIGQVMGSRGLGSIIPALGQGIASLATPTTIALAAMTAAGYAGYAAFGSIIPQVESLDDVIQRHSGLVGRLKDRYGEAAAGARGYAAESAAVLAAETATARRDFEAIVKRSSADVVSNLLGRSADEFGRTTPLFSAMAKTINDLSVSLEKGEPNLRAFREAWAKIEVSPYATDAQKALAAEIRDMTSAGAEADLKLRELPKTIGNIGNAAKQYASSVDAYSAALERLSGISAPSLTPREEALKAYRDARMSTNDLEASRKAAEEYEKTLRRIANEEAGVGMPVPTARPSTLSFEPPKADQDADKRYEKQTTAAQDYLQAQRDELEQTRLEATLIGQADAARRSALDTLRAEQKIRDLGIGLHSREAEGIRATARAMSEADAALKRSTEAWKTFGRAGENAIDTVFDSLMDGDLKGALNGLLKETSSFFADLTKNAIKNAVLGTDLPTLGDIGNLFQRVAKPVAANNNAQYAAPVGAVTRAALPTSDIASYISEAARIRGIDPVIALKVARSEGGLDSWNLQSGYVKNGVREQSYGPFQLYTGGGLGNEFQRRTGLNPALASSGPAGVDFALDHASKNGWGAWYGAERVGIGKWDRIGASKSAEAVSGALDKITTSSTQVASTLSGVGKASAGALEGLSGFGSGLGQVSQQLLSAASGANNPGSILGSLGGLFGGINPTSALWAPNTTLGSLLVNGKANGGYTGPGGVHEPAGVVHCGEIVWSQRDIARAGGVATVEGMRLGRRGYAAGGIVDAPRVAYPMQAMQREAAAAAGGCGSAGTVINLTVNVDNPRGDRDIQEAVDRGVSTAIKKYDGKLPARVQQIQKRPYVRGQ